MGEWRGAFAFAIVLVVMLAAASWLIRDTPDLARVLAASPEPAPASNADGSLGPPEPGASEALGASDATAAGGGVAPDAATIAAAAALASRAEPAAPLSKQEACEGLGGQWRPESRGWCDLPLPSASPVSDTAVLVAGMQIPCPQPLEKILERVVAGEIGGEEMRIYLLFRSLDDDLEELVSDEETGADVKLITEALRRVEADMRARAARQRSDLGIDTFLELQNKPAPGEVRSGFGMRVHPVTRYWSMHNGVDISGDTGDPVTAVLPGEVLSAQSCPFYGNTVVVYHGAGLATLYAHLHTMAVRADDAVRAGGLLGEVGATGRATGPHLHFEARIDGAAINAAPLLPLP